MTEKLKKVEVTRVPPNKQEDIVFEREIVLEPKGKLGMLIGTIAVGAVVAAFLSVIVAAVSVGVAMLLLGMLPRLRKEPEDATGNGSGAS